MDAMQEPPDSGSLKRKRSPSTRSPPFSTPPAKVSWTPQSTAQLEINYLARQIEDDVPLITADDTMPSILVLLDEYNSVLERHESLAYNLGARPLGPILVKRFERLFDGPPKSLKSHVGRDGHTVSVTWLDVIEFARTQPDQFTLGQTSDGTRTCQFHTKQCRVEISEEDFLLIQSGLPQKMIPPQPIAEDEEKELGTLEIVERNVQQISSLADQVAARARQFNHKLRSRKQAIIERRASDTAVSGVAAIRASSPSNVALMNGLPGQAPLSPTGFNPVNIRQNPENNVDLQGLNGHGDPVAVSQSTRDDLLKSFFTLAEKRQVQSGTNGISNQNTTSPANASPTRGHPPSRPSRPSTAPRGSHYDEQQLAASLLSYNTDQGQVTSTPTQSTPLSAIPQSHGTRSSTNERDEGGVFRAEMVARLETIAKGERINPPCDRCRRLHMECLKNLTACVGCTKKHAKCSWKDVKEEELRILGHAHTAASAYADGSLALKEEKTTTDDPPSTNAAPDDQQPPPQLQVEGEYSYEKQYRTHDEEMQAARSLAMAAVADAATLAQIQMQRDPVTDVTNGHDSPVVPTDLAALSNGSTDLSNVDPNLQSIDASRTARLGGR